MVACHLHVDLNINRLHDSLQSDYRTDHSAKRISLIKKYLYYQINQNKTVVKQQFHINKQNKFKTFSCLLRRYDN